MQRQWVRRVVPSELIDFIIPSHLQVQAGGERRPGIVKIETWIRCTARVGGQVVGLTPKWQRTRCVSQGSTRGIGQVVADVLVASVHGDIVPIRCAMLIEVGSSPVLERGPRRADNGICEYSRTNQER